METMISELHRSTAAIERQASATERLADAMEHKGPLIIASMLVAAAFITILFPGRLWAWRCYRFFAPDPAMHYMDNEFEYEVEMEDWSS